MMKEKKAKAYPVILNSSFLQVCIHLLSILLFSTAHTVAFSQIAVIDSITNKLEIYRQHNLQERLFLHTSKSFYVAGEIIWFKVYAVNGYLHQPLNISKVAYVEVINQDNTPVLQAKIALKEGFGNGTLMLPQSISTGNYTIRAYTAWMKNFDENFYFHQHLTIVNTLKRPDWQKVQKDVAYDFQLYPEGGNLVQGLESKVAFQLVDGNGKGQKAEGVILNANKDTIQYFKTHQFGRGHFRITPQKDQRYIAIARLHSGQLVSKELPLAFERGTVMAVNSTTQNEVNITVTTNTSDNVVYLLAHSQHAVKATSVGTVVNGKVSFTLNKSELEGDINHFTIFNKAMQPLCERLYFNHPKNKLVITAQTNKQIYSTREKVDLSLLTQTSQRDPVTAQLSLSVHLADSLLKSPVNSIESYLLLTSDLKGFIENPSYYFKHPEASVAEALDNLMLTNGWSRYKWEDIFKATLPSHSYLPEYEGHILTATVIEKKTGQTVSNMPTYLSVPGTKPYISYAVSNKEGKLQFITKHLQGTNEVGIQTYSNTNTQYTISIDNPFSAKPTTYLTPSFTLSETLTEQLALFNQSIQVQNNFMFSRYQQFDMPVYFDTTAFYGQPDKTYYLDDYTRFTSMEEVMREYVMEVRVRKQTNGFRFEVFNTPYKLYFEKNPLVILDGIPIFDINKIMAINPLKVRKIDIVARKYFLGSLAFDGIVNYSSYDGNPGEAYPDVQAFMLAYEGTQLKREFYKPLYERKEEKESRLPDFRNQLHWEPEIQTNTNGQKSVSFYTSDLTGDYVITVQGLTADGLPGSTSIMIRVNK